MIFRKRKSIIWIDIFKKILRGGSKCLEKEVEKLMKMGLDQKGAKWLIESNIAALNHYFTLEEKEKIRSLFGL